MPQSAVLLNRTRRHADELFAATQNLYALTPYDLVWERSNSLVADATLTLTREIVSCGKNPLLRRGNSGLSRMANRGEHRMYGPPCQDHQTDNKKHRGGAGQ